MSNDYRWVKVMPVARAIEILKTCLSPELFRHCAAVAETSALLARRAGCNEDKARLAGWLHDCARELSDGQLLVLAEQNSLPRDTISLRQPVLLHAPVGAVIARQWGFADEEVLEAIGNHTLGLPGLSMTGRIVYAADKIEPGRAYPGVEKIRARIDQDFHTGLQDAVAQSISYVLQRKQAVHPMTVAFWNWLTELTHRE